MKVCEKIVKAGIGDHLALVYFRRGLGYQLQAEHSEAIADYEKALSMVSGFAAANGFLSEAYLGKGNASLNKKNWKQADDELTKAIQLNAAAAAPYVSRCTARLRLNRADEAMADCDRAVVSASGNGAAAAYAARALVYQQKGLTSEALADANKAREIDPQNETAREIIKKLEPKSSGKKE